MEGTSVRGGRGVRPLRGARTLGTHSARKHRERFCLQCDGSQTPGDALPPVTLPSSPQPSPPGESRGFLTTAPHPHVLRTSSGERCPVSTVWSPTSGCPELQSGWPPGHPPSAVLPEVGKASAACCWGFCPGSVWAEVDELEPRMRGFCSCLCIRVHFCKLQSVSCVQRRV